MERHEAIIIGGGLNGLTAAAYLARAGVDVLLLDRNEKLGVAEQGIELPPASASRVSRWASTSCPPEPFSISNCRSSACAPRGLKVASAS